MSNSKEQLKASTLKADKDNEDGTPLHEVSATGIPLASSTNLPLPRRSVPQIRILHDGSHHQTSFSEPSPDHDESSESEGEVQEDQKEKTGNRHTKSSVSYSSHRQSHEDLAVISRNLADDDDEPRPDRKFKPKYRKELLIPSSRGSDPSEYLASLAGNRKSIPVNTLFQGMTGSNHQVFGESVPSLQASTSQTYLSVLKEEIMPTKEAESRWDTAFHRISKVIADDDRFLPRNIAIFDKDIETDSSEDERNEKKREAAYVTAPKQDNISIYSPFFYSQRPFLLPKLGKVADPDSDDFVARDRGSEATDYEYRLDPVPVSSMEWASVAHSSNMFNIIRKWNCPEPSPDSKPLPVEVDPLVKCRLDRKGKRLEGQPDHQDQDHQPQPGKVERERIQKNIQIGISPSGRKLLQYDSESGEEHVFKRVQCRHDPDFDLLQPSINLGPEGTWPNPYLYYWNWKQTKEDVDEHIKPAERNPIQDRKRQIAEELERDPMKIPLFRIGADDTDGSDPDDTKEPHVVDPMKPRSLRWKFSEVREPITDPLVRRYPYLYRHLQGKYYNKYYKMKQMQQAHKRKWYLLYLRLTGRHHSGFIAFTRYPFWYVAWKRFFRFAIRKIPRKWKFLKEKRTETLFYGTMASLYQTQYIAEYDVLPNMDDPVMMSEIALGMAMGIKEKFLIQPEDGGKPYVDYLSLQRSKGYEKYFECIGLLCRYQPIKMPPRVRKVFFINYFNVLSIQTQIRRIPEVEYMKYLWEMEDFWEMTKGLAGYMEFSLEEIYHGILRCNRIHPLKQVRVFLEDPHKGFPKEMSQVRLSLDWFDPRIHFALNVGTKSCPPLMIFSLYEQDCQLEEVARTYIRSRVTVDQESRTVTLPILFLWYEKDFGDNQRVLLWYLKRYLFPKDTLKIRRLVTSNKSIKFRYERFDDELEPLVVRHPETQCRDEVTHKKIIPEYWGHRY